MVVERCCEDAGLIWAKKNYSWECFWNHHVMTRCCNQQRGHYPSRTPGCKRTHQGTWCALFRRNFSRLLCVDLSEHYWYSIQVTLSTTGLKSSISVYVVINLIYNILIRSHGHTLVVRSKWPAVELTIPLMLCTQQTIRFRSECPGKVIVSWDSQKKRYVVFNQL